MEPSLIGLFFAVALLAVVSYYAGWVANSGAFGSRARAGFIVFTFVLLPFIGFSLYSQATAKSRLSGVGLTPHPDLGPPVGLASGIETTESESLWLFRCSAGANEVFDFYSKVENRSDWRVRSRTRMTMTLERGDEKLTISAIDSGRDGRVIFRVEK